MANEVTWRKVDTDFHETGQTPTTRTDTEYQIGAEIDGVFVPFTTVHSGRVDMYKARAEAEKQAAEQAKAEQKSQRTNGH